MAELVAALCASHGMDKALPGQRGHDLLQIFQRDLLAVGHSAQRNTDPFGLKRKIQHQPQGIASFGG